MKGEWQAAIDFVMKHRPGEKPQVVEARQHFHDGELQASMRLMPSYAAAERAVIQVIAPEETLPIFFLFESNGMVLQLWRLS